MYIYSFNSMRQCKKRHKNRHVRKAEASVALQLLGAPAKAPPRDVHGIRCGSTKIMIFGGFLKWGYPKMVALQWKIPSRNGWWLGVPPLMETPIFGSLSCDVIFWAWKNRNDRDTQVHDSEENAKKCFNHVKAEIIHMFHKFFTGEISEIHRGILWFPVVSPGGFQPWPQLLRRIQPWSPWREVLWRPGMIEWDFTWLLRFFFHGIWMINRLSNMINEIWQGWLSIWVDGMFQGFWCNRMNGNSLVYYIYICIQATIYIYIYMHTHTHTHIVCVCVRSEVTKWLLSHS